MDFAIIFRMLLLAAVCLIWRAAEIEAAPYPSIDNYAISLGRLGNHLTIRGPKTMAKMVQAKKSENDDGLEGSDSVPKGPQRPPMDLGGDVFGPDTELEEIEAENTNTIQEKRSPTEESYDYSVIPLVKKNDGYKTDYPYLVGKYDAVIPIWS